jgi:hypothetical protein
MAEPSGKVKAMLMLDECSDNYTVELNPDEALEFVRHAKAYNDFTSEMLVNLISGVNQLVPKMRFEGDNPNNGKSHHTFIIGNEGSRVIYLKVRKFYLLKRFQGVRFDYKGFEASLKALGEQAHADEMSTIVDDKHVFMFRWWWD